MLENLGTRGEYRAPALIDVPRTNESLAEGLAFTSCNFCLGFCE